METGKLIGRAKFGILVLVCVALLMSSCANPALVMCSPKTGPDEVIVLWDIGLATIAVDVAKTSNTNR